MQLPVFLPNVKPRSTKDLIMRIFTEEESITNQKLFLKIKKKFGVSVTYQAVRQALMELTNAGVLDKKGREYSISPFWVKTLYDYTTLLKKKYIDETKITIINENTKEIHLNSLNEMGNFLMHSFHEHFFDMRQKHDLYMFVHHLWFPFFDKRKRKMLDDFFSRNKNYVFVANKTFVDKIFSLYYKKLGKLKFGVKLDNFFDIIIQGDCIAKIYMPQELRERMDKVYKSKNLFSFKNLDEFCSFTFHPYSIKVSITRDKVMAEEMKQKMRDF